MSPYRLTRDRYIGGRAIPMLPVFFKVKWERAADDKSEGEEEGENEADGPALCWNPSLEVVKKVILRGPRAISDDVESFEAYYQ